MQLKKVVELAGMIEHCHFHVQTSAEGDLGRLRPDMIVRLPAGKKALFNMGKTFDSRIPKMRIEGQSHLPKC